MSQGPEDVSQLTKLLAETKVVQLNEITISGKGLKLDSAEDAKEIVDKIKTAKDVEALRLEGNTVGVGAAKAIAEVLKERKEFQKAFWSDMFTGRLRSEIPPSLECLGSAIISSGASLTVLDLSDNAFGPDGVKGIRNLLMSRACYTLEVLKLNNNGLGTGGGKLLSQAFLECHRKSVEDGHKFALKVFISGRNRLENEGAKALGAAFKVLGTLEEIQIPQNGILHPGITALVESLEFNTNLKILNLNDNTCTEKGAAAVAKILPKLTKLEVLNLGDCLLRNSGAIILGEGLKSSQLPLKELVVSFNEIRREGALAICEGLADKNDLELFNIDGNQLGESTEELEVRMADYGKVDCLAPFDENEEPDSGEEDNEEEDEDEEDEEEEDEEEEDEEEEEKEEKEGKGGNTPGKEKSEAKRAGLINGHKESYKEVDHEENAGHFLQEPSKEKYAKLPNDKAISWIRQVAKKRCSIEKTALEDYVDILLKVTSATATESNIIQSVTDAVFPDLIVASKGKHNDIAGAVLVRLGLIKSEKKLNKFVDAHGPLQALTHAAQQKYWPQALSEYFIVFMSKPNKILDHYPAERHSFLQKLYQRS